MNALNPKRSKKAKDIASRMAEMSDDCGRYERFDEDHAAGIIDEMLGNDPIKDEEIRRLEIALQAERDCVLRQQRELNHLRQHQTDKSGGAVFNDRR